MNVTLSEFIQNPHYSVNTKLPNFSAIYEAQYLRNFVMPDDWENLTDKIFSNNSITVFGVDPIKKDPIETLNEQMETIESRLR